MIQCTSVYIKDVQRNKGVMTVSTVPLILYRQDQCTDCSIQHSKSLREFKLWNSNYTPAYPTTLVDVEATCSGTTRTSVPLKCKPVQGSQSQAGGEVGRKFLE